VEERPFRAASERLCERGFSPGDKQSSDSSEALHHLSFVILSDARRSVAPERESKDLCTLAFQRWHQGILTVHSVIKLFPRASARKLAAAHPIYLSS
jgi:hypothetical protein